MKKRIDANMRQFFFAFRGKIIYNFTNNIHMGHEQTNRGGLKFERLFIRCYATTRAWFISVADRRKVI